MKALTLIQPWAGLVASGVKLVENRPWKPPAAMIGERFALHAGKTIDFGTVADLIAAGQRDRPVWRVRGAVVATARIVAWITHPHQLWEYTEPEQARWFFGPIGFVLADVRELAAPVPCKGMLGFWQLPPELAARVQEQTPPPRGAA